MVNAPPSSRPARGRATVRATQRGVQSPLYVRIKAWRVIIAALTLFVSVPLRSFTIQALRHKHRRNGRALDPADAPRSLRYVPIAPILSQFLGKRSDDDATQGTVTFLAIATLAVAAVRIHYTTANGFGVYSHTVLAVVTSILTFTLPVM